MVQRVVMCCRRMLRVTYGGGQCLFPVMVITRGKITKQRSGSVNLSQESEVTPVCQRDANLISHGLAGAAV